MDLSNAPTGFDGTIIDYQGDEFLQGRLMELGFIRSERLSLIRKTPFGDFVVLIRGALVALRHEEAKCLLVTKDK